MIKRIRQIGRIGWIRRIGLIGLVIAAQARASFADDITARLARGLSDDGAHQAAALEYRRLALGADAANARAGYAWAAAHEYGRAEDWPIADKMLTLAENADPDITFPVLLLRGASAAAQRQPESAEFYFQCLRENPAAPADMRRYAARRSAAILAGLRRTDDARAALVGAPGDNAAGLTALQDYQRGRDKQPWLGGVLGIIPGLGYAYAGEYANAARSLILNGLFIFGMVSTAEDDQWGAFAVITFFEFTWYSGSIYGGLDATHRYNRQRQETCQTQIIGAASYTPDWRRLPLISLQFEF